MRIGWVRGCPVPASANSDPIKTRGILFGLLAWQTNGSGMLSVGLARGPETSLQIRSDIIVTRAGSIGAIGWELLDGAGLEHPNSHRHARHVGSDPESFEAVKQDLGVCSFGEECDPAFVGVRWGFAVIEGGRLMKTEECRAPGPSSRRAAF